MKEREQNQYKEIAKGQAGISCTQHKPFVLQVHKQFQSLACNNCNNTWQERVSKTIGKTNGRDI